MTTSLSFASTTPRLKSHHHHSIIFTPNYNGKLNRIRCNGERPTSNSSSPKQESEPENALLKVAWYSSELLGIAASFFRSPSNSSTEASEKDIKLGKDVSGAIDRAVVVETIKEDFQKSYFVTGFLKFTFQSLSLSLSILWLGFYSSCSLTRKLRHPSREFLHGSMLTMWFTRRFFWFQNLL